MRRFKPLETTALVVSAVLILVLVLGVWNVFRPVPPAVAAITKIPGSQGAATLDWPGGTAEAAIAAIGYGTLGSNGGTKALPTASIAKVITALAVLQKSPINVGDTGPIYTVTANDVAIYHDYVARDGSVVAVAEGEQITEYQALQALMLPSANNIADSLTVWVFGSFGSYKTYASQMVTNLGMADTVVGSDASGLAPDTVSTPLDLIKLGEAALANPVLAQIVAQKSAVLPVAGTVRNVNSLLNLPTIIGIKTGNSDEAGGCLLFAAKTSVGGQDITVIGAVLGTPDLSSALQKSVALISSAFANFSQQTPVHAGQVVGTYKMPWGGTAQAVAKEDITYVAWKGDDTRVTAKLRSFNRAQVAGGGMGSVIVANGKKTYDTELITKSAIPGPSLWWLATRRS